MRRLPKRRILLAVARRPDSRVHPGGVGDHQRQRPQHLGSRTQYSGHEFHRFVNEAFREWAEEKANPDLKAERAIDASAA